MHLREKTCLYLACMKTNQQQPASFKKTQILYYSLFIGQVLMGIIFFYIMRMGEINTLVVPPYNFIIPGAVVIGWLASYYVGQLRGNSIPEEGSTQEKLEHYQTSSLFKYALAEGGNLISLVFTFMMANTNYLIWFGFGLAAFILLKPNREQFMDQYKVRDGEEFE